MINFISRFLILILDRKMCDLSNHLYLISGVWFDQRGHSEEFLSPKSWDWHQPYYNLSSVCHTLESQRGHLHEVSHQANSSFQDISSVDKRPPLAHRSHHLHPLGRVIPADNTNRPLQVFIIQKIKLCHLIYFKCSKLSPLHCLQLNQAEKLLRRQPQSSSAYQKPHLKSERRQAPNLQQQHRHISGSGMRAVFLGSRMGSSGTGVFLPRTCSGNDTESHTKPSMQFSHFFRCVLSYYF